MTIDINELEYQPASCCGQHVSATLQMPDGTLVIVNKGPDEVYQVMRMRGGILIGPVLVNLSATDATQIVNGV